MEFPGELLHSHAHRDLNEREREILRKIVHLYILKASPVGSRFLSKFLEEDKKLSPATLRNIMSDLEELEYISHPHTSAGRMPTDKGYRFYVDTLNANELLSLTEQKAVEDTLNLANTDTVLKEASKLLGMLSRYLGVVKIPYLEESKAIKIELIQLTSHKILIVLALDSNIVRTVTLEAFFEIESHNIDEISRYMNERISGKPLKFIRDNFVDMLSDFDNCEIPLIRLFIDSVDKIFENKTSSDRLIITGAQNILAYPEFEDLSRVRGVIELVENEDVIIHILDKFENQMGDIQVLIGSEMDSNLLDDYSIVLSSYKMGSAKGSIGLIGPKRMNYSKMMNLVEYVSKYISES